MQFRSRDLFAVVFLVALTLGFVAGETPVVAVATGFFLISSIGISIAIWISGKDLVNSFAAAVSSRRVGPLGARIKWLMIDGLIFVWLILAISVANFVLNNYVGGARTMLIVTLFLGPLIALVLVKRAAASRA